MPVPRPPSRDRILAAAEAEFAERGYAGAGVDRIARRARVNKAMIYYHFGSKQALYRQAVRRLFDAASDRLRASLPAGGNPSGRLRGFITTLVAFLHDHPHMPRILIRELAEGGAHLDRETIGAVTGPLRLLTGIVSEGIRSRAFRPVHPALIYISIVAPTAMFLAGEPVRDEIIAQGVKQAAPSLDAFVAHLLESTRRILIESAKAPARRAPRRRAASAESQS